MTDTRRTSTNTKAAQNGLLSSMGIFFEYLTTAVALARDRSLVHEFRERSGPRMRAHL